MRYSFTGKDGISASETLKQKTMDKLDRLSRIVPENSEVFVNFSAIKKLHIVEVTIPLKKHVLRAEVSDMDVQVALDQAVDILEKQMLKFKSRLNRKAKIDPNFRDEFNMYFAPVDENEDDDETENESTVIIKRSKKFALKPMDAEEAVMNMELLGHSFFVFRNAETDEVGVVYRRNDGTYGLIEPQC